MIYQGIEAEKRDASKLFLKTKSKAEALECLGDAQGILEEIKLPNTVCYVTIDLLTNPLNFVRDISYWRAKAKVA